MKRIIPVCCALVLCAAASGQVNVEESGAKASLDGGTTKVSLEVRNRLSAAVESRIELEWLEPDGTRAGSGTVRHRAAPGTSLFSASLPLGEPDDALLLRLHYRISPGAANLTAFVPSEGMLSFAHIAEHAFRLMSFRVGSVRYGQPWEVHVAAVHPVTGHPVRGVKVEAEGKKVTTGADGLAAFRFEFKPEDLEASADIEVKGTLGDVRQEIDVRRPEAEPSQMRVDTDKPMYQPGQVLHARALVTGGRRKADDEYTLRVRDDKSTVVHEASVKLSRFGVVHTDWTIPENAEPGSYRVEIEHEESGREAAKTVTVKRYELPSFRVSVQPDRGFYLRGQKPAVEVRADFMFGKPVTSGAARIVTDGDAKAVVAKGALTSGVFRFVLDLADAFEDLETERFRDLHYRAFVTDSSTNRTEERRFDIRISRDPIHLYRSWRSSGLFSPSLYVFTYTPDGKPLVCDVTLLGGGKKLLGAKTNRFGVARIEVPPAASDLVVRAVTGAGMTEEKVSDLDQRGMRLDTDKSLYRAGEPVVCTITSARRGLPMVLLASSESGQVVFSRSLRLDERATVTIPYHPKFGRELMISAVSRQMAEYQASRVVAYPGAAHFHVEAQPGRSTYRPGEHGSVTLRAMAGGAPVEAALGVAIVDQSVFERAASDAQLGRSRWFDTTVDERRVGGLSRTDLLELDPAKIDADLQLVAEVLLESRVGFDSDSDDGWRKLQRTGVRDLLPVKEALDQHYHRTLEYPKNDSELLRILGFKPVPLDPWLRPYQILFETRYREHGVRFVSPGPDKRDGTEDDFTVLELGWQWFLPFESQIRQALGKLVDLPSSEQDFAAVLGQAGLRWDTMRHPWGRPLRARVAHQTNERLIEIQSDGPDGKTGTADDVPVASFRGTYFSATRTKVDELLTHSVKFPTDAAEFRALLAAGGVDFDAMRDPWDQPYQIVTHSEWQYSNVVQISTHSVYGGLPEQRRDVQAGKHLVVNAEIKSSGADRVWATYDDVTVAMFSRVIAEAPEKPPETVDAKQMARVPGTGGIVGVVTDVTGAVIPNVQVILEQRYRAATDPNGRYEFAGVPPGRYRLAFESPGFQRNFVDNVPVSAGNTTRVDARLEVGAVAETISVAAAAPVLQTDMAMVSAQVKVVQISTPRLREYFPETLLWQPELITGSDGRAHLDVKLADNITTWHVAVIASTEDGRITETSTEIRAFQPFFADLDPPQVLTAGDRIELPVPIRNYLDREQTVNAETAASGLTITGGAKANLRIAASDSANHAVGLLAQPGTSSAKLRVTARAAKDADAIEKKIAIHPDGLPVSRSISDFVRSSGVLSIDVPAGAISGTLTGEVKLYPSLMAHVLEAAESLLRVPTGCAEQTISSAYPNLLFLRALKRSGVQNKSGEDRARRYLEAGYRRLLGYRDSGGGFSYWGKQPPDAALTAHAIKFLADAAEFIAVDSAITEDARKWLAKHPPADASREALALRALLDQQRHDEVLDRLGELARRAAESNDPYAIAAFALAALEAEKPELARPAIERLRAMANDEQGPAFWHAKQNTPFYGWGRSAQMETTALVTQALAKWAKTFGNDRAATELAARGLLFLVRNKTGTTWFSTQTTFRVLDAMLDVAPSASAPHAWTAEIRVNGRVAASIPIPASNEPSLPVSFDASPFLKPGVRNEISVSGAPDAAMQMQFSANWYEPWSSPRGNNEFEYSVRYEKTEAAASERLRCDVTVTRTAFQGYGMMIAEVGLPPGAEVDRGTLADLVEKGAVDSTEVWPDRVIFYVWPRKPETQFSFWMRPRYSMDARTAPSTLYDYYNPDARVTLEPARFRVTK
ncbi:MAG: carboxypeptidase regulatory-like domain-containing protein [Bryobacteraceae bacterium]